MPDFELSPEVISRVRDATDVVEVVSDHVRLRRRGRTWEGLCPFHEEKTPSFSVDPEKGFYYCFGCHQGGDIFKFVMTILNLSFPEAVEHLAGRFGVRLPARSPEARRRRREAEQQRRLLEEAQHFFVEELAGERGAAARHELERRGFPTETWRDFGFGFAPDDWRRLLEHLRPRHPDGSVVKAGLAVQPDSGRQPYDRFRRRLMFPIRSSEGHLIAFGGRILGDGEPKYLNSPEGPLFHKRSTLFALDRARREITRRGEVLVVEGYFDCLSLQRVGFRHVVATLGTSLTADHARMLRRLLGQDGRVLLCYDADSAGRRAAAAGAQVLLQAGVDVAIVTLQGGKDPDDIVREQGTAAFQAMLDSPTDLLAFLLEDLPDDPEKRRRAGLALAPLVCSATNPATRENLIMALSRGVGIWPRDIEAQVRQPRRTGKEAPHGGPAREARSAIPPGERDLARILIDGSPETRHRVTTEISAETIGDGRVRDLLRLACRSEDSQNLAHQVMSRTDCPELQALVAELGTSELPPVTDETAAVTIRRVLQKQRRHQAFALQEQIERAHRENDLDRLAELMQQKIRLRQSDLG